MQISLSLTTLIFLFVVCLCGGIIIGAMFGRAKKIMQETSPEIEEKPKEEPSTPAKPRGPAREDDTEILRAWRDGKGKMWLEMDSRRLEGKEQLNAEQKKRLLDLVMNLRPWLDIPSAAAPAPAAAPRPPVQPPRPAPPAAAVPAVSKPVETKPKIVLKSIVEQIDDVLQEKLTGTVFAGREIRLLDGAGGRVIVQIEEQTFEGIDAVSDAEIKALIRQAIAEWEKKAG